MYNVLLHYTNIQANNRFCYRSKMNYRGSHFINTLLQIVLIAALYYFEESERNNQWNLLNHFKFCAAEGPCIAQAIR